jgi:hypothetical protein
MGFEGALILEVGDLTVKTEFLKFNVHMNCLLSL